MLVHANKRQKRQTKASYSKRRQAAANKSKLQQTKNKRRKVMAVKIALAGNPNCGKTTLFNALTGSNQFVGNWPGVTVEKKEGKLKGKRKG